MRTTNVVWSGRAARHTRQAAACTTDMLRGASNLATRPRGRHLYERHAGGHIWAVGVTERLSP